FARVVAAGAGEHGHFTARFVDEDFDNPHSLVVGEGRALPGGATRHQKVNTGIDLTPSKTTNSGFVEIPGRRERGDHRSADAGPISSHSVILAGRGGGPPPVT